MSEASFYEAIGGHETFERLVAVFYAGQKVEEQEVGPLFADPHHPYTAALLAALPERAVGRKLPSIPGVVPGPFDRPRGCLFSPRCAYATDHSRLIQPELRNWADGRVRCHYPLGDPQRDAARARDEAGDRKSTRLNSSHEVPSRMPSSA